MTGQIETERVRRKKNTILDNKKLENKKLEFLEEKSTADDGGVKMWWGKNWSS